MPTSEHPLGQAMLDVSSECFAAMADVLTALGDDLANRRPDLPGANSCYAIVNHCIGVVDYWAGSFIAGQRIPRDRDSEFTATGRVDELLTRLTALQQRFPGWVEVAVTEGIRDRELADGVRGGTTRAAVLATASPEWTLLHILHDIAQHVGHLEITRDLLLSTRTES
ncbi:DUF664 domain-containing protein [Mycobacterium sp. 360MFTsu5.1]|uniref:mycothiol transferase n=1 Tax=Mycobacterium sp. 360MFTsu5.1 TaxID=1172186 RepID=UPI0004911EA5|nr:DUF664 domain-containing protein [Mycobacterium sp. 360MFTsu5.1]